MTKVHNGEVNGAVYNAGGTQFATPGSDNLAKIWTSTGELMHSLKGHSGAVNWAAFLPPARCEPGRKRSRPGPVCTRIIRILCGASPRYDVTVRGGVELVVTSALGERIARLVGEEQEAGRHTVRFDASSLPSGVYFYTPSTASGRTTRRMVVEH